MIHSVDRSIDQLSFSVNECDHSPRNSLRQTIDPGQCLLLVMKRKHHSKLVHLSDDHIPIRPRIEEEYEDGNVITKMSLNYNANAGESVHLDSVGIVNHNTNLDHWLADCLAGTVNEVGLTQQPLIQPGASVLRSEFSEVGVAAGRSQCQSVPAQD